MAASGCFRPHASGSLKNMAQGCCVLADRCPDLDRLGFVAEVDYWPYDDVAGAVSSAQYLIKPGRWRYIAANGKK